MGRSLCIMLVAAEPSGDALGAGLMRALRQRRGEGVRFVGVGGALMAAEGLQSPFDISELSIFGWFEGLMAYKTVMARVTDTAALAAVETPDVAVLIDSWGFTLRVAHALRAQAPGLKLIKYVGPQVFASRPKRAYTLAKSVDHLLSILAFDAPNFEKAGLKVTAVGNPTLAKDMSGLDRQWLRDRLGALPDDPILLVLPGSRRSEIARLMGPFGAASARLKAARPNLHIVLPLADSVADQTRAAADLWPVKPYLIEGEKARLDAMAGATAALACSGTVTTELAMAGCPFVVAYRLGHITHALVKRMIKTPYVTLINIAAGKFVAPELIQDRCNPTELAAAIAPLLDDPDFRESQVEEQFTALDRLGPRDGPDPSERAADVVIAIAEGREP